MTDFQAESFSFDVAFKFQHNIKGRPNEAKKSAWHGQMQTDTLHLVSTSYMREAAVLLGEVP